jgi:acetoin:2,6-dichlorophenolindophenol oxidoreductase subunit beta
VARITFVQAIGEALIEEMERDPLTFVLGLDVTRGTFGRAAGFYERFGPERILDTPLSEAGFVGAAVGAAMAGTRPICEVQFASFFYCAFDQLCNQAAKLRYMSGGQATIPLVLRMAAGAGLRAAAQHSDTFYALFTHVPGLKVVVPATPAEAQGLLLAAIADDNPVIFLEHMALYRDRGPVPVTMEALPLGRLGIARAGSDVTIACVGQALAAGSSAADQLASDGRSAEVISLRSLTPLDVDGIVGSVRRTGALEVVEEGPPRCSVAADIAATVGEAAFSWLRHPPLRVNTADTPVPFSPVLEDAFLPDAAQVVAAAHRTFPA